MTDKGDSKISVRLDGGVVNRTIPELAAPVAQQGASLNMIRSENTRLTSHKGTITRAPRQTLVEDLGAALPSVLLSSERARTTVSLEPTGQYILYEGEAYVRALRSGNGISGIKVGAYLPFEVTDAGNIAIAPSVARIAVCSDSTSNGEIWYAGLSADNFLWVSVRNVSGESVAALRRVVSLGGTTEWLGLTSHGANGFRIWYITNGLKYRALSIDAVSRVVLAGIETAVYTPATLNEPVDVCRLNDTFAVFIGSDDASVNNAEVSKINVTTAARTTFTAGGGASGGGSYGICADTLPEGVRIGWASSSITTSDTAYGILDENLGVIVAASVLASSINHDVAVQFESLTGQPSNMVIVDSYYTTSFSGGTFGNIVATSVRVTTGVVQEIQVWPYMILAARGVMVEMGGGTREAVFGIMPCYQSIPAAVSPGDPDYVLDPCIMLCAMGSYPSRITPIARVGCLRGTQAAARVINDVWLSSSELAVHSGNTIVHAYRQIRPVAEITGVLPAAPARFSLLQPSGLVATQPSRAYDKAGVGYLCCAMPVQFDGAEVVEMGAPVVAPKLKVTVTGGSGVSNWTAGSYFASAVWRWRDAAGQYHRSGLTNIVTFAMGGAASPTMSVSCPASLRNVNDQQAMECIIYCTELNGLVMREITRSGISPPSEGSTQVTLSSIDQPTADLPQLFSDGSAGQELLPQPPPPMYYGAVIGSRFWCIDAEQRDRAAYSKHRVAGVGFEFHPALELLFPSDSGDLEAILDVGGQPLFLARNGVYIVSGEGPDNTGQNGSYSGAIKISEFGCTNRASAVAFPGGAIWQDGTRWVRYSGGQVAQLENMEASGFDMQYAALYPDFDEVVFYSRGVSSPDHRVYNYLLDRWTTWDVGFAEAFRQYSSIEKVPWDDSLTVAWDGDNGELYRIDHTLPSTVTRMLVETDWLVLAGDFHDHVLVREAVFRSAAVGSHAHAHGLTIEAYTNFSSTATTTRSWTAAELAAIADPRGGYTVRMELAAQDTETIKFIIYDDTTGQADSYGMHPIALTIYFVKFAEAREETFVAGSYK